VSGVFSAGKIDINRGAIDARQRGQQNYKAKVRSFEQRENFYTVGKGSSEEPFPRKVNQRYRDRSIQSKGDQLERLSCLSRPQSETERSS
jgi:hypothetical protein